MLSQKIFRLISKVALVAIVFASLAPGISHALTAYGDTNSFMQEVCGVGGKVIYIKVVTTQGQQMQSALDVPSENQPVSLNQHMNHCPFCQAGVADVVIPEINPVFEIYLQQQEIKKGFDYQAPNLTAVVATAHFTRGPPAI